MPGRCAREAPEPNSSGTNRELGAGARSSNVMGEGSSFSANRFVPPYMDHRRSVRAFRKSGEAQSRHKDPRGHQEEPWGFRGAFDEVGRFPSLGSGSNPLVWVAEVEWGCSVIWRTCLVKSGEVDSLLPSLHLFPPIVPSLTFFTLPPFYPLLTHITLPLPHTTPHLHFHLYFQTSPPSFLFLAPSRPLSFLYLLTPSTPPLPPTCPAPIPTLSPPPLASPLPSPAHTPPVPPSFTPPPFPLLISSNPHLYQILSFYPPPTHPPASPIRPHPAL